MNENYRIDVGDMTFDIEEELKKVEVAMEDEIIEFFYATSDDKVKEKALKSYISTIISEAINPNTVFENFDYYDLLAIYEDLEETECEE